jgi:hypothetical protein
VREAAAAGIAEATKAMETMVEHEARREAAAARKASEVRACVRAARRPLTSRRRSDPQRQGLEFRLSNPALAVIRSHTQSYAVIRSCLMV